MKYLLAIFFVITTNSYAANYKMNQFSRIVVHKIKKELAKFEAAFKESEAGTVILHESEAETAFYLKRMRLMIAPFAAFDIAEEFEVKVVPLVEFRWTRKNPAGWINYRR